MIDDTIVSHWSNAFFQLAQEEKKVKQYSNEAGILIDLFTKYPEFLDVVSSSVLSFSEKSKIIKTTFDKFSRYMINFFLLLTQEGYFRYSLLILKEFRRLCNEYQGIQYGVVYSVVELSARQIKKLEQKISSIISKTVELVNKIDQSLIAGVKVKVKNQVFDGSVKGQIEQIKSSLEKNNQE
ncbi:MAG: F0F1 ATP synthase subunit delta [Spiroplasma sp.]|nr:F0F1 ATP synthase subunit delta [Spiroplasma sp.]